MKTGKLFMIGVGVMAATAVAGCSKGADAVVNDVDNTAQEASEVAANVAENVEEIPAVTVIKEGEQLPESNGKPQIIDFNATWCGPCKRFSPVFDMIAERYRNDADFYSVDVDVNPQLAAEFNVESIPTVIYILPDGSYSSSVGSLDAPTFNKQVQSFLQKVDV